METSHGGRVTSRGGRAEQPFDQPLFSCFGQIQHVQLKRCLMVCAWCFSFDMCSVTKKGDNDTCSVCVMVRANPTCSTETVFDGVPMVFRLFTIKIKSK